MSRSFLVCGTIDSDRRYRREPCFGKSLGDPRLHLVMAFQVLRVLRALWHTREVTSIEDTQLPIRESKIAYSHCINHLHFQGATERVAGRGQTASVFLSLVAERRMKVCGPVSSQKAEVVFTQLRSGNPQRRLPGELRTHRTAPISSSQE